MFHQTTERTRRHRSVGVLQRLGRIALYAITCGISAIAIPIVRCATKTVRFLRGAKRM